MRIFQDNELMAGLSNGQLEPRRPGDHTSEMLIEL